MSLFNTISNLANSASNLAANSSGNSNGNSNDNSSRNDNGDQQNQNNNNDNKNNNNSSKSFVRKQLDNVESRFGLDQNNESAMEKMVDGQVEVSILLLLLGDIYPVLTNHRASFLNNCLGSERSDGIAN